jgi:hypothetical protein
VVTMVRPAVSERQVRQVVFQADHRRYRKTGSYDFPQRIVREWRCQRILDL